MAANKTVKATKKTASTGKKEIKKSDTMKQIENLEKALAKAKPVDTKDNPAIEPENKLEMPKEIDFETEAKKIIENTEPSPEINKEIEDFEKGKEEFNKKMEKAPENAEEVVKEELKRVENIKKNVEALKNAVKPGRKKMSSDEFSNWWNGATDWLY